MENDTFRRKVVLKLIQFKELIYWVSLLMYLEILIRIIDHSSLFSLGIVFTLLFDSFFAVIFTVMIKGIKNRKVKRFVRFFITLILIVLFLAQLTYFQIMKTYFTSYSAENTGKVLEFADIAISTMIGNWYDVLLMILPLPLLLTYYFRKNKVPEIQSIDAKMPNTKSIIFLLIFACLCHMLGLGLLQVTSKEENSAYNLYYNVHFPEYAVDNLGLITYMRIDIQRRLFNWEPRLNADLDELVVEIPTIRDENNSTEENTEIPEATAINSEATETSEVPETTQISYNMMDINFDDMIASEKDDTIVEMHQYFKSLAPTPKNASTGKYRGYNLILITAEGFSHLAVSEALTPTLYKMMHEGVYFENFYTPIWGVSTSDGEYVATTGLIPKSGVWSYKRSSNNAMPFALGNQLRQDGYTTHAYHDHTYTYYDRNLSHPNMGYDYKGVGNGLELTKSWPESDLEMMEVTFPEYGFNAPFHTYYMTVSGHMFYDFNGNAMSAKNYELVKDLPYSKHVKAYLACQIELEKALANLIDQLEKSGQLAHTLIAISADHYPYGLTKEEMEELAGHVIDDNFELYKNAFILYNNQMTPEVYSSPASSLDILPTLSNLMGLTYDSRLLMGRDLFSDTPPLVIFSNRSYITNEGSYNTKNGKFLQNENQPIFDEATIKTYRKQISNIIKAKFYYSAKILEKDYYRVVFNSNSK
ncbi:LTA synthase family protein [Fusibacter bizertensis]